MIDVNKFPITANLLEGADEGHVSRLSDRAIAALVHGHVGWARVYSVRAQRIVISARLMNQLLSSVKRTISLAHPIEVS